MRCRGEYKFPAGSWVAALVTEGTMVGARDAETTRVAVAETVAASGPPSVGDAEATGAGEIWVTHGREEALVHACTERGIKARALALVGYEEDG